MLTAVNIPAVFSPLPTSTIELVEWPMNCIKNLDSMENTLKLFDIRTPDVENIVLL